MQLALVVGADCEREHMRRTISDVIDRYRPRMLLLASNSAADLVADEARQRGVPLVRYPPTSWSTATVSPSVMLANDCDALVRITVDTERTVGSAWSYEVARALGRAVETVTVPRATTDQHG